GRDQGTVAFPHPERKLYLTASPEARARPRVQDLTARGVEASLAEGRSQQMARDHPDSTRPDRPFMQTPDMVELVTDGMTPAEVVDRLEAIVRQRMAELRESRVERVR